jgi:hypothetical protein
MKRSSLCLLTLVLMVAFQTTAFAGDEGGGEMTPEQKMAADMAVYMKYAQPGEHHEHLKATVGTWETSAKAWPAPGAEPMTMSGTMESHWILGGRFLQSTYSGSIMGTEFTGMAIDGYDNFQKKYVGSWRDTMGTMTMLFEGHCEQDGKVRIMIGEFVDPASGQKMKNKGVTTILDENTYRYESYMVLPDGSEFKNMELVATRKS